MKTASIDRHPICANILSVGLQARKGRARDHRSNVTGWRSPRPRGARTTTQTRPAVRFDAAASWHLDRPGRWWCREPVTSQAAPLLAMPCAHGNAVVLRAARGPCCRAQAGHQIRTAPETDTGREIPECSAVSRRARLASGETWITTTRARNDPSTSRSSLARCCDRRRQRADRREAYKIRTWFSAQNRGAVERTRRARAAWRRAGR